jgi:hypothetical protein
MKVLKMYKDKQKITIYFVYTVPMGTNIFRRAIDKLIRITNIVPPLHRYGFDFLIPWRKPNRAPHSHSRHLLHEFKKYGKVRFYSLYEKGVIHLKPDDIFFGQPVPQGGFGLGPRPETDDHESITSRTLRENIDNNHNKFFFIPFANDPVLMSWAKDLAFNYADKVILQGGEFWTRDWKNNVFGQLDQKNVLRVNNAIDPNDYYFIKKSFNPPDKRKFLYIGHTAWYKNTVELERIASQMPGFVGGHIGGGIIKGWKNYGFSDFTPEFLKNLADEYDIFINTSSGDANATTILENICFGFPVACTPETGFEYPSIIKLSTTDTAENIKKLTAMKNMSESELKKLVEENMKFVKKYYTWDNFLNEITKFMGLTD